jgi:hypothetical protein
MKGSLLHLLLLLVFGTGLAQETQLTGRVVVDTTALGGAHVINRQTGTEVKTAANGTFSITVKPGQNLVVTSGSTDVREFYISAETFKNQPYVLQVNPKSYELEVVVIEKGLTAEGLGLVPKGQKQYTAQEKKVLHFQGQQKGLSGFVNWLKGRKFLMGIEEKYAGKRVALAVLEGMYAETGLERDFQIPKGYTAAFLFFAVEDEKLEGLLREGRTGEARMMVPDIALKYLQTISTNEETIAPHTTPNVPAGNGAAAPAPAGQSGG